MHFWGCKLYGVAAFFDIGSFQKFPATSLFSSLQIYSENSARACTSEAEVCLGSWIFSQIWIFSSCLISMFVRGKERRFLQIFIFGTYRPVCQRHIVEHVRVVWIDDGLPYSHCRNCSSNRNFHTGLVCTVNMSGVIRVNWNSIL